MLDDFHSGMEGQNSRRLNTWSLSGACVACIFVEGRLKVSLPEVDSRQPKPIEFGGKLVTVNQGAPNNSKGRVVPRPRRYSSPQEGTSCRHKRLRYRGSACSAREQPWESRLVEPHIAGPILHRQNDQFAPGKASSLNCTPVHQSCDRDRMVWM